jgi:hypothetical protein
LDFQLLPLHFWQPFPLAFGDTPGRHPAYLHARTDLRRAERLMDWPEFRNVKHDLDDSAHHVREAIHEIDGSPLGPEGS